MMTAATSPSNSLWQRVSGSCDDVVSTLLWPLLDDADVIHAMMCSRESHATTTQYRIRTALTLHDIVSMRVSPRIVHIQINSTDQLAHLTPTRRADINAITFLKREGDIDVTLIPTHVTSLDIRAVSLSRPLMMPPSLTHLLCCDDDLSSATLPPSLTDLHIAQRISRKQLARRPQRNFIHPLRLEILPPSLTRLTWEGNVIDADSLPPALRTLQLGAYEMVYTATAFPSALTKIVFADTFSTSFDTALLPSSLTHVSFGNLCRGPLSSLPATLRHLSFGDSFDAPIPPDTLPVTLTHLSFGSKFNQLSLVTNLKNLINLTFLNFGKNYNQILPRNILPSSLLQLNLGSIPSDLTNVIPLSVTHLTFPYNYQHKLSNNNNNNNKDYLFPPQLTHLSFNNTNYHYPLDHNLFPQSLTSLTFDGIRKGFINDENNNNNNNDNNNNSNYFPNKLKVLYLGYYYEKPLVSIINNNNNNIINNIFPHSLTKLTISFGYNHALTSHLLPDNLLNLTLINHFNRIINPNILSQNLTNLSLLDDYNSILLPNVLPKNLLHLTLGHSYNQPIDEGVLPFGLFFLFLGRSFKQKLKSSAILPFSLVKLKYSKLYQDFLDQEILNRANLLLSPY